MTITIEGLSPQQRQIADLLWSCDSQEAVQLLITNMPPAYRKDAVSVHQLMIAAAMDQYEGITDDVKTIIDHVRYS